MAKIAEKKVNDALALLEDSMSTLRAYVVCLNDEKRALTREIEDLPRRKRPCRWRELDWTLRPSSLRKIRLPLTEGLWSWRKI